MNGHLSIPAGGILFLKGGESMTLPGECVNDTQTACMECGTALDIQVLCSAAGYYVGFFCPHCGPYSRESGYYASREEAEQALSNGFYGL